MTRTASKPLKLFCSYSHRDERYLNKLKTSLAGLRREGLIKEWHDRRIRPGQEWEEVIDEALEVSQIVLLLVTPDFMGSDYSYEKEMSRALARHERGEARVIPIIVCPTDWEGAPFGKLQALPKDAKPITTWSNRDQAWLDVVRGIREVVKELTGELERHITVDESPESLREADIVRECDAPISFTDEPRKLAANTAWPVTAPAPPLPFIGRECILEELRKALVMNQAIALQGMGGVGKTATAKELANEASVDFPGGVFWGALPDHDGRIVPILRTWLQSCGGTLEKGEEKEEDDLEKEEDDDLINLLVQRVRDALKVRRTRQGPLLIIVDDVRQRWVEAAKSLQKALPDKTPLLTTTQDMNVGTALGRVVQLPNLPPSEALSLLKTYAGASFVEDNLQTSQAFLYGFGYLPLAIEIVGKRLPVLSLKPGFNFATFVKSVEQRANEVLRLPGYPGLSAIFSEAYNALPAEVQRIFRTLGAFSTRLLPLEAIASWSEMNVTEAEPLLDKLVTASLLAWGEEERTYRLHPLLGQYAKKLFETEDKSEILSIRRRRLQNLLDWVKVMEQDFQGLRFLSNMLHDIKENHLPEDILKRFLQAMSELWELGSPEDRLWNPVINVIYSDPNTYLCQGPEVPLGDRKCSRILGVRDFIMHHIDLAKAGFPITSQQQISSLEGRGGLTGIAVGSMRGSLPFAHVTRSESLFTLLSKTSSTERGSVVRSNWGARYFDKDNYLVEVRYPESVMRNTKLTAPTCLDLVSDISRSVQAPDGWGRSINLETLADGLPMAVHPPIPFTDEFEVAGIGRVGPPSIPPLALDQEAPLKGFPYPWTPDSSRELLKYV